MYGLYKVLPDGDNKLDKIKIRDAIKNVMKSQGLLITGMWVPLHL